MAWVSVVPRRAIFSQEINGRIGVYRNVFDVLVEYKQRCYRYEWPLDRSKDRFHWSSVFLCAIFHLVETEVTPSSIVAVDHHHHHQTLSTERETFSSWETTATNTTQLRICVKSFTTRERERKKRKFKSWIYSYSRIIVKKFCITLFQRE